MITAIVLINTEVGRTPEVAEALVETDGVAEAYSVAGDWDVVAIVKVHDYEEMAELVPKRLAAIDGITRTTTLMAFRRYSKKLMERMWEIGFAEGQEGV
jgi:DNA-binding Lrp family transcriptional regulator